MGIADLLLLKTLLANWQKSWELSSSEVMDSCFKSICKFGCFKNPLNFKKNLDPISWIGFNCLNATELPLQGYSLLFTVPVPGSSLYSMDWHWKDEILSWPWSNPLVLNMGPLDLKSSTLIIRPLLHFLQILQCLLACLNFTWDSEDLFLWFTPKKWFFCSMTAA